MDVRQAALALELSEIMNRVFFSRSNHGGITIKRNPPEMQTASQVTFADPDQCLRHRPTRDRDTPQLKPAIVAVTLSR